MEDENEVLIEVVSDLAGVPRPELQISEEMRKVTAVAEALRVAASQIPLAESRWRISHVMSLRSWVIRKLRGLPCWADSPLDSLVLAVLSEGRGPSLEFLGDFLSLKSGYYAPSPSRAVPIAGRTFLLVSGVPSRDFVKAGLTVKLHGPSRWLVDCSDGDLVAGGIDVQTRLSYLGELWSVQSPASFLADLLNLIPVGDWRMESSSEAYLGHRSGTFGFDSEWGSMGARLSTGQGLLDIWRSPRAFAGYDFFLRMRSKSRIEIRKLPPTLVKRTLLAFEAALGANRKAHIEREDTNLTVSLDFGPPASMMRWIHALGGVWKGPKSNGVQWELGMSMRPELVQMLKVFWIAFPEAGG